MEYTQQEINNFYSKYSCCFASLATDYTNSLAIGAFDCGQKLDKLLQFKSYLDILKCYKVDTCIINQPEVESTSSSWYFGIGNFSGTITYYMVIDGVETFLGSGTSVSTIVDDINNNTDASGATAVLGEGGYFTIYSPLGCFVKADLYGIKSPSGTIPASQVVFNKGRCAKEENCEQYTEEQLNCISNEDLDKILFWLKQTCLTVKNKPTISEIECTSSENEYTFEVNQSIVIQAGDSIEVERNGNTYTISNPLPDRTVSITAGSNITVTGTYPNFTISSTGGGSTTLMVDVTNAELITALTTGAITKGVIYRVTDAIGGIVQVIGRGFGSVTKAAYREGKFDTTLTQVIGIYGTYNPLTNTFLEQGRIATEPTVNEDLGHGYYVGQELKTLDTGITYKCTDATNAAAVWEEVSIGTVDVVGSVVDGNIPIFFGTTGKLLKDGGSNLASKVNANSAITAATKTKITYDTKGLVTAGADATTADIADSSNKRYVTDTNLTVINNTSGTNTGDNATNTQYSGLAASKADIASPTFTGTITTPAIIVSSETASRVAIIDGSKNIKSADTATYPSLTELSYVKNVTSPIQTQINGLQVPIVSCGNGTAVTGTTANTYSKGLLIPANSRTANNAPQVDMRVVKTGTAGTLTMRLYWNTTNDLSGSPILLGTTDAAANTTLTKTTARILAIEVAAGTGAGTKVTPSSTAANSDWGSFGAALSTVAIDWTSNGYLICAVQNGSSGDSSVCNLIKLH